MVCDSLNTFFGYGLKPCPQIYQAKRVGLNLITLAIVQIGLLIRNYQYFDNEIIHLAAQPLAILIHCLLLIGAHKKSILTIYAWMVLTVLCFGYMVFFLVACFHLFSDERIQNDTINKITLYIIFGEAIVEMIYFTYGIFVAYKATKEIKEEETTRNTDRAEYLAKNLI